MTSDHVRSPGKPSGSPESAEHVAVRARGQGPATGTEQGLTAGGLRADLPAAAGRVLQLQRLAGNRAVAGVVQRNDDGKVAAAPALDPGVGETHDTLQAICDAGEQVAWNLYRAVLELQAAVANERYGRMSTDSQIAGAVEAAAAARAEAVRLLQGHRQRGSTRWAAAQTEASKQAPDESAVDEHVTALHRHADDAAALVGEVAERAWRLALTAEENGRLVAARHAFDAADGAETVLQMRRPTVRLSRGRPEMGVVSAVYGVGIDTSANTIGGGTYGNIITGVTLDATSGSTLANVGTASTAVLGPLAVLCSTIGLVLGVVGAAKSHRRAEELEKLKTVIADPHARAAADYALAQKERKQKTRLVSSGVAVAGLAAGIAACVTLGVTTFGVGALVIGIIAALAGFGLLAYRIYRSSPAARKKKMKAFAKSMVKTATDTNADPADRDLARNAIATYGAAPASGDFRQTDIAALTTILIAQANSQRDLAAMGLLDLLVNGRRSQRRDAELVLTALGLDAAELLHLAEQGDSGEAHNRITAKLGSW